MAHIEKIEMNEETSTDLLYKWDKKSINIATDNPLIILSVQIWYKLHEQNGFLSPKSPLWRNRLLPMVLQNSNFRFWSKKGTSHLERCYEEGIFMFSNSLNRNIAVKKKAVNEGLKPLSNFTDVLLCDAYVTISSILPILQLLMEDILASSESNVQLTAQLKSGMLAKLDAKYANDCAATAAKMYLCRPRYH